MNRLQKFVERGRKDLGRTTYVLDPAKMPKPEPGLKWQVVADFRPGDAILADPSLKSVFAQALKHGCKVVWRKQAAR